MPARTLAARMACAAATLYAATAVSAEPPLSASLAPGLQPVDSAELDLQRGREGLNVDDMVVLLGEVRADAHISDNVLTSQQTGANLVEAGAFGNASGLVFSVQNSGNHVVIQNTTLINVNMQP
ncbi:hypothetical protein [Parahaliea aestuarii]|uniref:Uncharacterized protein n=1 Tax=Parahaliea aestuarii TaxID=1852021 RepID=A0A5C8ZMH6_9GAMM|nr:hypothetical protein [Parahaliea aestuarii]TXS89673.1 hypothetical protein FVW59_16805 [Parahaliea aestuarii]